MNQAYLKNILSAKFDFNVWKELFDKFFPKVEIFTTVAKISDIHVKDGGHIGNIRLDDGRSLAIFRFEVADNVIISRNRKSLRDIAAKYVDQGLIHGALVFYYSQNQDDYRLTFIAKQTYFNESGELVKKETAPKRYTFLLGKNEPCTTAASRLMELVNKKSSGSVALADVTEAFSVERLNKEFFKGYKDQYAKFLKLLEDKKQHRDYVKKMLGRLVFLQFLQKKGWMGVPASNENWEGGDKNYLANLIERYKGNDRILSDVLEPLFFDTLNKERVGDIVDYRLGDKIKIPYLNGGLFDKDKTDALDIDFPYSYFKDLMDFFNMYNFTIDENDPDDAEVGVDPEMLGHIFENLLEDNKDKGAFYTPKEIVQYMCRQSVIQYLKTHDPDDKYSLAIERLINDSVVEPVLQNKETASRFVELLKNVKVCDPAIGSGAFPMGILYVLYYALHHLQSHAEPNKSFDSTKTKRDIIQNNIFGVDIEQGAVDIARLRFWLALVVDAEEPHPLPNLDYKITCGNSLLNRYALDTPLNNVFIEYNKDKKDDEKLSLVKYKQLVNDYTNTSNHTKKDLFRKIIEEIKKTFKTELSKKEINKIVGIKKEIYDLEQPTLFGDELTKQQKSELKKLKSKLDKLESERESILNNKVYEDAFEWRFEFPQLLDEEGKFIGFDIVIGNPPYIQLQNNSGELANLYEHCNYQTFAKTGDIYCLFYERGWQLLCQKGSLCFITSNKWMRAGYGEKTRAFFAKCTNPKYLIDFAGVKIFDNATVDTNILIFGKEQNEYQTRCAVTDKLNKDSLKNLSDFVQQQHTICTFNNEESWVILSPIEQSIKQKIESVGTPLKDWDIKIYRGVLTGYNDAFIISTDKREEILANCQTEDERLRTAELIRPILRGRDIKRYGYNWADLWLIATFPSRHYDIEEFPAVKAHLLSFGKERLEQTGKKYLINGEEIKARKKTSNKWFETQDSISYWDDFLEPKVMYPNMTKYLPFYYDEKGFYQNDKSFMITGKYVAYLTAFLNSSVFKYCYLNNFPELLGGTRELRKIFFDKIPVMKVSESINNKVKTMLLDIQKEYTKSKAIAIDTMIFDLYDLSDEERELIGFVEIE